MHTLTEAERKRLATEEREWIFTFGFGHSHPETGESLGRKYVRVRGTCATSRVEMERRFGRAWAFQYPTEEMAGVTKYGLSEYRGPDGSTLSQP